MNCQGKIPLLGQRISQDPTTATGASPQLVTASDSQYCTYEEQGLTGIQGQPLMLSLVNSDALKPLEERGHIARLKSIDSAEQKI